MVRVLATCDNKNGVRGGMGQRKSRILKGGQARLLKWHVSGLNDTKPGL
jgi:hypothetical protein